MPHKKHEPGYYDTLMFLFRNADAFIPLAMIPFGLLAGQAFVSSPTYTNDPIFFIITITYITASSFWFWYLNRIPQAVGINIGFTILFHLLTMLFLLFVSGFLSAFLAVWILLIISADIRFGTRGFLASFGGLVVAGILNQLANPGIPPSEHIEIIQGILVIGLIGFVMARIRAVSDRERTALAKTREQEAYQRERLLALVNSMGDAVVATDKQGAIKLYNSTFLNLLDTNLNLTGKTIDQVLNVFDASNHHVKLVDDAHTRRSVFSRTDLSYKLADGEIVRLYVNIAPIQPSYRSHAESGFIFILRDITKEKTLEEERDEFISVVSHELRTPVTIAEGGLSNILILQERGASADVLKGAAKGAHDQILYLSKLINDLSALARAERGLGAETEELDLTGLLHGAYATYAPQAKDKGLAFNIDIGTQLPRVICSRLYLEEILQNLITNSLKYTKQGSITVSAKRNKAGVSIAVTDTGIGISKSDQKHIFEKFYRSEDYRTRESNGTGLGLYVCMKLAEKIGLSITFESRLNHGSTFTLVIPAKQIATGARTAAKKSENLAEGEAKQPGSIRSGPSS